MVIEGVRMRVNVAGSGAVSGAVQVGTVVQVSISKGGVPKRSVDRCRLDFLGLEGDRHNPRAGHGGRERALCLLAVEIIEKLQQEGHEVYPGAIGENLTVRGIDWSRVAPGDQLRIGDALIEITRFTAPCKNIAGAFKDRDFTRVLHEKNPGEARVYAKVLEPGEIATGMRVEHFPVGE
jgi:MOSC domain-containing protein YiiM